MQPGSETREPTIADLMTALRALRDDNAALRGRLEAVEARETDRIETTRPSASPSPSAIDDQVSRRRLLRRTGTAVAGIAGAVALGSLAQPMPARAGIPNYLSLGSCRTRRPARHRSPRSRRHRRSRGVSQSPTDPAPPSLGVARSSGRPM